MHREFYFLRIRITFLQKHFLFWFFFAMMPAAASGGIIQKTTAMGVKIV